MQNSGIVDAHHHLWNLDCNYYPWLVDKKEKDFFLGDYSALKKNYLPESVLEMGIGILFVLRDISDNIMNNFV